ncbi:tetratricopeptide repeat protein [Streptomyces sp. NPDC047042]|uniref:tetratricopeptide repeat protein n=1 Tax=Streptomyces sp. NPDC047042 TaxID=3154807 RepID=UPI0033DC99B6
MTLKTDFDRAREQAEHALRKGRFPEAEQLYTALIDAPAGEDIPAGGERQQDGAHRDLPALLEGHALALYGLARYQDAEARLRDALERRGAADGPMAAATLSTMARLAEAVGEQRRWTEARELAREAKRLADLSPDVTPETRVSISLALPWLLVRTQDDTAIAQVRALVTDAHFILGTDHPHCWAARHLFVQVLYATGAYEEAELEARNLLELRNERQGPVHPHTLLLRRDLALILHAAGRHDEAAELITDTCAAGEDTLGPEHPCTAHLRTARTAITEQLS